MSITFNPLDKSDNIVLLDNDLRVYLDTTNNWSSARVTDNTPLQSGRLWYWEVVYENGTHVMIGVASISDDILETHMGVGANSVGWNRNDGLVWNNGSSFASLPQYAPNDVIMIAVDPEAGSVWFGWNGVWFGDPETNTDPIITGLTGTLVPCVSMYSFSASATGRFSNDDYQYTIPDGFDAKPYIISDIVKVNGIPREREVRIHSRETGELLSTVYSSGNTGRFTATIYNKNPCYFVVLDDELTQEHNPVARDMVIPQPT